MSTSTIPAGDSLHRREFERLARLERVADELRALARTATDSTAGRGPLTDAVREWERDIAAVRQQLVAVRR